MRDLLGSDEPRAQLAVDYFVYRIGRELGSLAAALGGLDALVFTAGIGENSPAIRERICRRCGLARRRARRGGERSAAARASARPASRVSAWVIPTNEELMIARHTGALLGLDRSRASDRHATPKEADMAATATQHEDRRRDRVAWRGFRPGLWQKRDQRPRLHPAELHAVRRRRRVPAGPTDAHAAASGRS